MFISSKTEGGRLHQEDSGHRNSTSSSPPKQTNSTTVSSQGVNVSIPSTSVIPPTDQLPLPTPIISNILTPTHQHKPAIQVTTIPPMLYQCHKNPTINFKPLIFKPTIFLRGIFIPSCHPKLPPIKYHHKLLSWFLHNHHLFSQPLHLMSLLCQTISKL